MPTTTWRSSTKAKRWRCTTRSAWPHRPSELCCTPRIVAAPSPAAPCPAISAKPTTTTPTPPTPSPTSTTCPCPATPTTNSPTKAGPPAKTRAVTPNGSHPPTSTTANPAPTPTGAPKNCYATTATTSRSELTLLRSTGLIRQRCRQHVGFVEAEVRYSRADDKGGQMHVQAARTILLVHCCNQRIEADYGKPVAQLPAVRGRGRGATVRNAHVFNTEQIRVVVFVSMGQRCSAHRQHATDDERCQFHTTNNSRDQSMSGRQRRAHAHCDVRRRQTTGVGQRWMRCQQFAYLIQSFGADLRRRGDAVAARCNQIDERLRRKVIRPLDVMTLHIGERLRQGHVIAHRVAVAADDAAELPHPAEPLVAGVPHQTESP